MLFIFQLIVGSKQMHQMKPQQNRVSACLSNTTSEASCIAFGTLACPTVASMNIIEADSGVGNLLFQIFINIKADLDFTIYSSSILRQMNKMCGTSQMVANEHKFIINASSSAALLPSFTKPNKDFRLFVEFIIPNSEREHYVLKSTFVEYELIDASRSKGARKAVKFHSKISLHFGKDFAIFCEGDWMESQQLTRIFDGNSNAAISQQLVGLGQIGLVGLVDHIGLADQISLVSLSDFTIISLVGSSALFVHRLISLIGLSDLGLNSLVGSSASFARQLIGLVSLVGLSIHRLFCDLLTAVVITVKTISRQLKQAGEFVVAAVQSSATEIANAASTYYLIASLLHMHSLGREKT